MGIILIRSEGFWTYINSPVDTNSVAFNVNQVDSAKFYIAKLELIGNNKLKVEFNLKLIQSASGM